LLFSSGYPNPAIYGVLPTDPDSRGVPPLGLLLRDFGKVLQVFLLQFRCSVFQIIQAEDFFSFHCGIEKPVSPGQIFF
jgi:hypothetical protein